MSSFQISKARLKQIIREEQTKLDEIARPIGADYGDNADVMEALGMAYDAIRKARTSNTPLAQDVGTDAYMMAKRVEESLTNLMDMIEKSTMQPGNRDEELQELASFESVDVGDFVTVVGGVLAGSTDGESDEATVGKVMSTGPDSVEIRLTNVSSSGQKYKQKGDMATVKMDHISPSQGAYDRAYGNRNDEAKQKSTKKYDDNPKLKGDQDELPDSLQKAIIKKAGGDEEEEEEKNESLELEAMIRKEILAALNGV